MIDRRDIEEPPEDFTCAICKHTASNRWHWSPRDYIGGKEMAARDYTSAPVTEQIGLPSIIAGLCSDLEQLRKEEISVNDAMARSMLAKQIFNGVRIYLNGTKLLSDNARVLPTKDPV